MYKAATSALRSSDNRPASASEQRKFKSARMRRTLAGSAPPAVTAIPLAVNRVSQGLKIRIGNSCIVVISMASAITHFIVGAALALPAIESASVRAALSRWAIPVSSGLLAVSPDLDTFAMRAFGISYGSFFGHRGFFHSPFFLILLALTLAWIAAPRRN